ncbi:MAG: cobalamin-dependent protein [bacterium]
MAAARPDQLSRFRDLFLGFQIDSIAGEVGALVEAGIDPKDLLGASQRCMEEIGKAFEEGRYYLPELIVAGEMFNRVSERIRPGLASAGGGEAGRIVLGTPKGDIHHLGKDIFRMLAEASGFAVYDLGVDVPPEAFVRKLAETGASVLGMSALITAAFDPMKEVLRLLEEKGLRSRVKVIIGGGVTTKDMVGRLGVDGQTQDAYEGLKMVRSLLLKAEAIA